jgi:hypothetical protein
MAFEPASTAEYGMGGRKHRILLCLAAVAFILSISACAKAGPLPEVNATDGDVAIKG